MRTLFWILNYLVLAINALALGFILNYDGFFYSVYRYNLVIGEKIVECKDILDAVNLRFNETEKSVNLILESEKELYDSEEEVAVKKNKVRDRRSVRRK